MEETGLENMTENTEKEKVLSKEAIVAALNERHSPEKQKLLSAGRVAIAGLGGLGSNVAYALARIGVGHLHLIDFDVVDITNLNRQQYFMEHLGMYKTDALKSLLLKINPYLDIQADCVKVTEENIVDLLRTIRSSAKHSIGRKQKRCWSMVCWNISRKKAGIGNRNGRLWQQQHDSYETSDEKFLSVRRRCDRAGVRKWSDGTACGNLCGTRSKYDNTSDIRRRRNLTMLKEKDAIRGR